MANQLNIQSVKATRGSATIHDWYPAEGDISIPAGATFDLEFLLITDGAGTGSVTLNYESTETVAAVMAIACVHKDTGVLSNSESNWDSSLASGLAFSNAAPWACSLRLVGTNDAGSSAQSIKFNPRVVLSAGAALTYWLSVRTLIKS